MFNYFGLAKAILRRNRIRAGCAIQVQPKARTVVSRLMVILVGGAALVTLSVVVMPHIGAAPTIIEPPPEYRPGQVPPLGTHCGGDDATQGSCYPPVDAHCYQSGDADWSCLTSAAIQYHDKQIALMIDVASRTIALTSISAPGYTMGDLMLAWGTPTGFNQSDRAIDVYWGARSTSLTTCSFRPESKVDVITFYRSPAFAAPWHGFVRVNSKTC